ncbi:hypothetical protein [Bradyrhizobium oligotrophicum]|uniref:hypothetical protein n=1 Tax=Bradyrhizobium oligotrophicum TaxID=44255 RepID=UPI003EBF224E
MLDILTQIVAVCLVSYAIAVLMPSWRALLVAALLLALATMIGGLREWWTLEQRSCSRACPLEGLLDIPLLPIARAGFITGAIVRALTFQPQARGQSPRIIVMICIAGGTVALAVALFAPSLVWWRPLRIPEARRQGRSLLRRVAVAYTASRANVRRRGDFAASCRLAKTKG